jgi:glycosyltransferase involved in cell wall biosynthesis
MNPTLSVLVPFFNHNEYIGELLSGIVDLTEYITEIVIINDGSEQDPEQIIKDVTQGRNSSVPIRYYKQENAGICVTLNRLIELSKGELIAIIASDDLFIADTIKERVEFLRENTDCDAVIGDAVVIDQNGATISKSAMSDMFRVNLRAIAIGQDYAKKELIYRWGLAGPCLITRRAVYRDIGSYNEGASIEDRDFYLRLFALKSVFFMEKPVAKYRLHGANTSTRASVIRELIHSNARNAHLYTGLERIYLSSYWLDSKVLELVARHSINPTTGRMLRIPTGVLREILRLVWKARVWVRTVFFNAPEAVAGVGGPKCSSD